MTPHLLELVLIQVLDQPLDLGRLEQAHQLQVVAHEQPLVPRQLRDHRPAVTIARTCGCRTGRPPRSCSTASRGPARPGCSPSATSSSENSQNSYLLQKYKFIDPTPTAPDLNPPPETAQPPLGRRPIRLPNGLGFGLPKLNPSYRLFSPKADRNTFCRKRAKIRHYIKTFKVCANLAAVQ